MPFSNKEEREAWLQFQQLPSLITYRAKQGALWLCRNH